MNLMSYISEDSSLSDIETVDLNNSFIVKKIKHNRNRPRIYIEPFLYALAFDVVWEDNTETREPIQNLINNNTHEVNENIIDIIKDYKETAIKYPRINRCCIMCINKVNNGRFMCFEHAQEYNFLTNL